MQEFLFYLFAVIAVVSGVAMVLHRNPVYSAIFLIITLFAFAGFFVLLNAPFVATVHIIVYAGAIMVLFLFVIMLLNLNRDPAREAGKVTRRTIGAILVLAFLVELGALFFAATANNGVNSNVPNADSIVGSPEVIVKSLFTTYLFPFEVASILLLVGMVGAIILAKRKLD